MVFDGEDEGEDEDEDPWASMEDEGLMGLAGPHEDAMSDGWRRRHEYEVGDGEQLVVHE